LAPVPGFFGFALGQNGFHCQFRQIVNPAAAKLRKILRRICPEVPACRLVKDYQDPLVRKSAFSRNAFAVYGTPGVRFHADIVPALRPKQNGYEYR
jgi:hypothetical protein